MFLFDKPPTVIFIKKNSLTFYLDQKELHLEFPVAVVKDADIANPSQYEKLVEEFLTANNIKKQKAILVLSEEIVFQKIIPFTDQKMLDEESTRFSEMIPVERENLREKTLQVDSNIHLFALNKWLIEKLIEILKKQGWEITAAVPLTLFTEEKALNADIIKKLIVNKQLIKRADCLTDVSSPLSYRTPSNKKNITILLILILVIIFAAGALFFRNYFISKNKLKQDTTKASPVNVATESAESKVATETATLSKDQLNVTVLNGTSIAGEAAKVKDLLIELGLSQIETGNAEGAAAKETVAVFSSKVATELRQEIISVLEENFASVSAQVSDLEDSDILITTGAPKTGG